MKVLVPLLALSVIPLASCARLGIGKSEPSTSSPSPFGPTGVPPMLRPRGSSEGTPVAPGGSLTQPPQTLNLTPEEDIIFTDPDNPESNLPELAQVLSSAPRHRGPWEQSESIAKQLASREGKPLLIWFTDSQSSPMCKALSQELFSTPDFEKWASENLVRLRVDVNVEGSDFVRDPNLSLGEKETRIVDARNYVTNLKKRYKVLGHPTLLLLNPSGEVIGRYRGYKRGQADFTWGLIKQGEAASAHAYESWRKGLEKKGYREWSDRRGRKVFARLTAYSNGTLILIEPDGTRCKTHEDKLSDADQQWLKQQKALRGH